MNRFLQTRVLRPRLKAVPKATVQPIAQASTYADTTETALRMRAQSILSGALIGQCPPLTAEQAADVIAWYRPAAEVLS